MIISVQDKENNITSKQVLDAVEQFFARNNYRDKRLLLIVPDNTRSGPIGDLFKTIYDCIGDQTRALDILVALGTHQPLDEKAICRRLDITPVERNSKYARIKFFNHEWQKKETFTSIGIISADEIEQISSGLFREAVDVSINKLIYDYDEFFILGPVFPHEVVGFSGGHKYIFPGIAAADIINFFHWLGAIITNPRINGNKWTPTRKVVEKAASFINMSSTLFALVAINNELKGLFIGDVIQAWEAAADLSSQVHIIYKDKSYHTILGITPQMYDDLWVAGKVMYKLEPIVADGGTLIIYAPHIDEVSYSHGKILDEIGYHTRDYFRKQWDTFKHYPRGVTAHSTHVKGIGTYENGLEKPRINVVLATSIPRARCQKINLGFMDPQKINIDDYRNREHEGILVVDHAGESLYRLTGNDVPTIPTDLE
ncbi:MAG: DUF2088 domain-containing protein [Sedimentisphaerales bacterium]|nr:DUF2088 domain-containing protein [Sedimentisphaerales bacterium]